MARCYPDFVFGKKPMHAENRLLRRVRAELPDEVIVLPSLEHRAHDGYFESESDLIVLHPRARLHLEVKGGLLRRVNGHWQRQDWKTKTWEDAKDPFSQSRTNSYYAKQLVEEAFGKESPEAQALFGRAVVFPDMNADLVSGEMHEDMFLDQRDIATPELLRAAIERLIDLSELHYRQGKQRSALKQAKTAEKERAKAEGREPAEVVAPPLESFPIPAPMTDAQLVAIAKALRPDIKPIHNLAPHEVERELVRFSASQLRALDCVEGSKRLRVLGGPGSGKTLLAFESIRRELRHRPDSKVGLFCFNRSLGGFLADVAEAESLAGLAAGSFYVHVDRVLGDEGRAAADSAYYRERTRAAVERARALPEEGRFDLLVVDEGQDFRDDADKLALMDALLKGGLAKGRWRWFEDLDQVLTPPAEGGAAESTRALTALLDDEAEYVVRGNWRNSEPIVACACKALGVPYEEDDVGLHGPTVVGVACKPGQERELLDAALRQIIGREVGEGKYRPEDVVVLSMRGGAKASFEGCAELGGYPLEPYDITAPAKPGVIRTSSVFKFKGLESHAVVLTDVDSLDALRDRRKAYVGITRARYRLVMLGSAPTLGRLFE